MSVEYGQKEAGWYRGSIRPCSFENRTARAFFVVATQSKQHPSEQHADKCLGAYQRDICPQIPDVGRMDAELE